MRSKQLAERNRSVGRQVRDWITLSNFLDLCQVNLYFLLWHITIKPPFSFFPTTLGNFFSSYLSPQNSMLYIWVGNSKTILGRCTSFWTMFKVGSQFWQIFFWELFQMIHLAHFTSISKKNNFQPLLTLTFQHNISILEYHRPICIRSLPQPRCGFVSDWTSQRVCCSNGTPYQTPRRKSRGVLCRVGCHEKPSLCDT